tara:strand:+ start:324 stop:551 length:228 start_codon:yes stop_codon:yes gene_type:complete
MSKKDSSPKKPLKNALILTGVAFQMGATTYLFVLLGNWLDKTYNHGESTYVAITTIAGVVVSLYLVIKQLNHLNS